LIPPKSASRVRIGGRPTTLPYDVQSKPIWAQCLPTTMTILGLKRECTVCPRVKFHADLIVQLQSWRDQSDILIICLDENEDVYWKSLSLALSLLDGLAMKEVGSAITGRQIRVTYFRGSMLIDAVWATTDNQVAGACVMPARNGIGNY
jgi:hypothetical protein